MSTIDQTGEILSRQDTNKTSLSKSRGNTRTLHVFYTRAWKNFIISTNSSKPSKQLETEKESGNTVSETQYYVQNACFGFSGPDVILRQGSTKTSEPILGAARFVAFKSDVLICLGDPKLPSSSFESLERPKFFTTGKYGWSIDVGGERRRYQWRRTCNDRVKEEGGTKWSFQNLKLLDITNTPAEQTKEEAQQLKRVNKERKSQGLEKEGERVVAMFLGNCCFQSFTKFGRIVIFEESLGLDEQSMNDLQTILILTGCALVEKFRRRQRWGSAGGSGGGG